MKNYKIRKLTEDECWFASRPDYAKPLEPFADAETIAGLILGEPPEQNVPLMFATAYIDSMFYGEGHKYTHVWAVLVTHDSTGNAFDNPKWIIFETDEYGVAKNNHFHWRVRNVPKKIAGYLNIYEGNRVGGKLHPHRMDADASCSETRVACVYVEAYDGEDGIGFQTSKIF